MALTAEVLLQGVAVDTNLQDEVLAQEVAAAIEALEVAQGVQEAIEAQEVHLDLLGLQDDLLAADLQAEEDNRDHI